jgi:hypothetical protein
MGATGAIVRDVYHLARSPFRFAAWAARQPLVAARALGGEALRLARRVAARDGGRAGGPEEMPGPPPAGAVRGAAHPPERPAERARTPAGTDGGRAERRPRARPGAVAPPPPPPRVEEHVSEEHTLVGEFAEAGAEQGAGPEVHVDEPWEGYDRMSAAEIARRLVGAGAAVAAAVRLYEANGRGRKTVLEAADRALR